MKPFIVRTGLTLRIDQPCKVTAIYSDTRCPLCAAIGFRRKGVGFDHEWRCGYCDMSWEPFTPILVVEPND